MEEILHQLICKYISKTLAKMAIPPYLSSGGGAKPSGLKQLTENPIDGSFGASQNGLKQFRLRLLFTFGHVGKFAKNLLVFSCFHSGCFHNICMGECLFYFITQVRLTEDHKLGLPIVLGRLSKQIHQAFQWESNIYQHPLLRQLVFKTWKTSVILVC